MPLAGQHDVTHLDRLASRVIGSDDNVEHGGVMRDPEQLGFLASRMPGRYLLDRVI